MATVIESMTGVRINSPFFSDPATLELFPDISKNGTSPKRNRVALVYGTNGSGKSTLAQGFREYEKTNSTSNPISPEISVIRIPYDILSTVKIQLAKKPQSTPLSVREQGLLDLMGISTLVNAKGFLSVTSNSVCPQCLQPISAQHRGETLALLGKILNREIEDFQNGLRNLMIPIIHETQYDAYSCVDATLVENIRVHIRLANAAIGEYNDALMAKIGDPMGNVDYEDSHKIGDALMALNALLLELEKKRLAFNKVIADRRTTEKRLIALNDLMGHFSIVDDYTKMMDQVNAQESDKTLLSSLRTHEGKLRLEQKELDAQRKNYKLAVDQINQSLSYIYFSKTRFEVVLESDQRYHLKVNGMPVTPDKISCGERNALALCYFFTEIAKETDFDGVYRIGTNPFDYSHAIKHVKDNFMLELTEVFVHVDVGADSGFKVEIRREK